jgi:hypothetical protein
LAAALRIHEQLSRLQFAFLPEPTAELPQAMMSSSATATDAPLYFKHFARISRRDFQSGE